MKDKNKNNNKPESGKEELPEQENTSAPATDDDDDGKINVNKSVFQINREMMQQRRKEYEEQQAAVEKEAAIREKKRQEAYDRRIREERIELMRLKQGIIEESETIHEEHEEPLKLTFRKKIGNFLYHNKWWLGIGVIISCIVGFLAYDYLTKPNPDTVFLLIADNHTVGVEADLEGYLKQFAEDSNKNGKVSVSVYYIRYSDDYLSNYANGSDNKLTIELQSADSVIVFGDKKLDEICEGSEENIFCDLEELFPGNPHVKGHRFMLEGTPFAERLGIDPESVKDMYIALRLPKNLLYCSKKDMEKTYEKDLPVLERIIADLS
ncbi:MAG: hypothetical protein IKO47_00790 [Ruminococcus sp.]|nr:hypothetical protein [Ruminococcus sp.]